ncbi:MULTISPECIES: type VI secretion system Vgr family protein [unclassified Myroides]|uniref:type VI secretion system Vgr family protein n=1 Tax=unclassified Myroides TaxID=2642485 RepID=UPI003D2F7C3B
MTNKLLFDAKEEEQRNIPIAYSDQSPVDSANYQVENNVSAIANQALFGVTHLVDLTIVVEGTTCNSFQNFRLNQSIKGHHTFELSLHHNALGAVETYQMVHARELLGKRILVRFTFKNNKDKPERDFIGIITDVSFEQVQGNRGDIILSGYSPTILLDKAPNIQSFGGSHPISLAVIVNQLLEEGYTQRGKYKYSIQSDNQTNISYSCQFNETAYNYLARMAEAYGEQFFYDGETLHFGEVPPIASPLSLVYGRDIDQVKVNMSVQHVNRELFGYNSLDHELLCATEDTKLPIKGTLAKVAYEKSRRVFTAPSLQVAPIKASTNQDITQAQRGLVGSVGLDVFVISGTTTVPFLYPGCKVELNVLQPETKENQYFTKLMITSIKHEVDALGRYKGYFEAVDAETGFIPRINYQNPLVEQQIATVVSNTDPQQKGRVQVRFDWQDVGASTAFIRVMTPDAGNSIVIDKNRGFVTIPEVGDQVLIGFVGQHPDRPLVMGSLFHGAVAAGGGNANNRKTWSTKSGHIIELDDHGGIKILDKKKNVFLLDGEGGIFMKSAQVISLQTGQSSLTLEEDGKITLEGEIVYFKGKTILQEASAKLVGQSGSARLTLDADANEATLTAKNATVEGTSVATVNGGLSAKVAAGGVAAIEGAIVKLN